MPVAALVTAGAVLGVAAGSSASVRDELRSSFTRAPSQYVELFFTTAPTLDDRGGAAVARTPVTLVQHGVRPATYVVEGRASASDGTTSPQSRTVTVAAGTSVDVLLTLAVPRGARGATIAVQLRGRPESLHYRITPDTP
ncbi:MAG TPA: hypothetical protein VGD11_07305 [Mycobacteriales bacterium]